MKTRFAALLVAVVLLLSLTCTASAAVVTGYNTYVTTFAEEVGWNFSYDITLLITGENTYDLVCKSDIYGTTDPGNKGEKTVIYSGTFSSVASADGETSHLDITLDTCDAIFFEQHDKAWGWNELNFSMMLNSAAWTDDMEDIAQMTCEEFLTGHSIAGTVLTVEDIYLDLDDVTLVNRIVSINGETPNADNINAFSFTE